jgi:hypothetical protein
MPQAAGLVLDWLKMREANKQAAAKAELAAEKSDVEFDKAASIGAEKAPEFWNLMWQRRYGEPGPFEVPKIGAKKVLKKEVRSAAGGIGRVEETGGVRVSKEHKMAYEAFKKLYGEAPPKPAGLEMFTGYTQKDVEVKLDVLKEVEKMPAGPKRTRIERLLGTLGPERKVKLSAPIGYPGKEGHVGRILMDDAGPVLDKKGALIWVGDPWPKHKAAAKTEETLEMWSEKAVLKRLETRLEPFSGRLIKPTIETGIDLWLRGPKTPKIRTAFFLNYGKQPEEALREHDLKMKQAEKPPVAPVEEGEKFYRRSTGQRWISGYNEEGELDWLPMP